MQVNGWCYVDPSQHAKANANLVAGCPTGEQRTFRMVGSATPQAGSVVFIKCE